MQRVTLLMLEGKSYFWSDHFDVPGLRAITETTFALPSLFFLQVFPLSKLN